MIASAGPRILSLLPSATEIVLALGLENRLVGATHECRAPAGVPRVTRGVIDPEAPAAEIHEAVRAAAAAHRSLDPLDVDAIRQAAPTLILTQRLCDVCAVPWSEAEPLLRTAAPGARLVDLSPVDLAGIEANIREVASLAGVAGRGEAAVAAFRGRIEAVRRRAAGRPRRPVLLLEWPEPPFVGAHWVPEMVEAAGGLPIHDPPAGEKARPRSWADLLPLPDGALIAVAACGMSVDRCVREITRTPLPVPAGHEIWALDGDHHWAKPGPNLAEGVEALAAVLAGEAVDPSAARRIR